jgi:ABC-type microcin C transport system duplicated ATPase subunit YejF
MIAMALANEPDLLIADEPTTALDVTIQAQCSSCCATAAADGLAMLLITHDLGVVRKMADRVCVMSDGEVVEAGPPTTCSSARSTPTPQAPRRGSKGARCQCRASARCWSRRSISRSGSRSSAGSARRRTS